jgi:peroxiredoxin Q/BCP
LEFGINTLPADEIAEMRARRTLLDEKLPKSRVDRLDLPETLYNLEPKREHEGAFPTGPSRRRRHSLLMPNWFSFSDLFSDPLPVGSPAPDFTLSDDTGNKVTLCGLRGRNVVLVFYPGDDTPVCTKQLCALRDHWPDLQARNVVAFGINPANQARHARFRRNYSFPFPLLSDPGRRVAHLYRASGLLIKRTVYLIGPDRIVRYAARGNPSPAEVLKAAA